MSGGHFIDIEFDSYHPTVTLVCESDKEADCHKVSDCECDDRHYTDCDADTRPR